MPFPFEALYPLAIIAAVFAGGGLALDYTHRLGNNGKPRRMMLDNWDKDMMDRDARITGASNIQLDPVSKEQW